jgi:hypothetical protein
MDQVAMSDENKSGIFSKMSLQDKLSILGVLVGILSVAVAVYFGYLSLKSPSEPIIVVATQTAEPTPTAAPPGSVYFEDDFESGLAKWRTNPAWEIREDELGDHMLCATPKQGYSFINPRTSTTGWNKYVFSVQVMLVEELKQQGAFTLDVLYRNDPQVQSFQFQITELRINLHRFDPDTRKWQLLTDSETDQVKTDTWYSALIQVEADGTLRYSVDGIQLVKYTETEPFMPDGVIRLGASPNSDICFDDVKVSVPQ